MAMTLPSQGRGFGFKTAFLLKQKTWEKLGFCEAKSEKLVKVPTGPFSF